jgi:hypothetical protein
VSFAKQINPLILDELRRLKATQAKVQVKPMQDRIERLAIEVTSATLRRLANLGVQIQA